MAENRIIARRAKLYKGRAVGGFAFGVLIVIIGIIAITLAEDSELLGGICIIGGAFFFFAGFYYIHICLLPEVLAELKNGLIYFYPSKKRCEAVEPQNILFVSQSRYIATRFNTQYSGSISITLADKKTIKLTHVDDIAFTHAELERLRDAAINEKKTID